MRDRISLDLKASSNDSESQALYEDAVDEIS